MSVSQLGCVCDDRSFVRYDCFHGKTGKAQDARYDDDGQAALFFVALFCLLGTKFGKKARNGLSGNGRRWDMRSPSVATLRRDLWGFGDHGGWSNTYRYKIQPPQSSLRIESNRALPLLGCMNECMHECMNDCLLGLAS
jgi:hypothetical protein